MARLNVGGGSSGLIRNNSTLSGLAKQNKIKTKPINSNFNTVVSNKTFSSTPSAYSQMKAIEAQATKSATHVPPVASVQNTPATINPSIAPSAGGGGRSNNSGGSSNVGGGYVDEAARAAQAAAAQAAQQEAQRNAMLKSMEDFLRNSSNAQYKQAEAGFAKTRDEQINGIKTAFDEAVKTGQLSIEEANVAFDGAVKQLEANLYRDSQLTQMTAFDRGIQNSQQLIGLQQGDTNRKNTAQNEYAMERTRRVNALNDRIASLAKQKDQDVNQANTDFNYNVTGARASADMALNDGLFKLKQTEYDQMQAMAQALASGSFNGGGGGGGGSSRTPKTQPTYDLGGTNDLASGLKDFIASKQQTVLDDYYTRRENLTKRSVMDTRQPLGAPVSVARNPTLTAYEKMKMFGG